MISEAGVVKKKIFLENDMIQTDLNAVEDCYTELDHLEAYRKSAYPASFQC